MSAGTDLLLGAASRVSDDRLPEPAALPSWSRAHLLTHLARNADALCNLLTWARTGVETPMYADPARRAADVEAGASREAAVIRDDFEASIGRLYAAVSSLPVDAWSYPIRTVQGRQLPVSAVPWLRCREVWVHAVDLDAGATFDALPADFVEALLADSLALFATRTQFSPVIVQALGSSLSTRIGGDGDPVLVRGTARDLLPWVLGRADAGRGRLDSSAGDLPELPAWL
jgi:maleylpyruvate isomerase